MPDLAMPPVPSGREMLDDELEKLLAWFLVARPINPQDVSVTLGEFVPAVANGLPREVRHPVGVVTELNGGDKRLSLRVNATVWRWVRLGLLNPHRDAERFVVTAEGNQVLPRVVEEGEFLIPEAVARRVADLDALPPGVADYTAEAELAFAAGLYQSTAVMLGAASEALLDALTERLKEHQSALSISAPRRDSAQGLLTWAAQAAREHRRELRTLLGHDPEATAWIDDLPGVLDGMNAIRLTRNEAGHPTLTPITRDECWGLLVLFPRIASVISHILRAFATRQ